MHHSVNIPIRVTSDKSLNHEGELQTLGNFWYTFSLLFTLFSNNIYQKCCACSLRHSSTQILLRLQQNNVESSNKEAKAKKKKRS